MVGSYIRVYPYSVSAGAGKEFVARAKLCSSYSSSLSFKAVFSFNGMTKEVTGTLPAGGSTVVSATLRAPCTPGTYHYDVSAYYYVSSGGWAPSSAAPGTVTVSGACKPTPKPTVPSIFNYLDVSASVSGGTVQLNITPKSGLFNYVVSAFGSGA